MAAHANILIYTIFNICMCCHLTAFFSIVHDILKWAQKRVHGGFTVGTKRLHGGYKVGTKKVTRRVQSWFKIAHQCQPGYIGLNHPCTLRVNTDGTP